MIHGNKFHLQFPIDDLTLRADVKNIEGWRWENSIKKWTVPASYRVVKQLEDLGFRPTPETQAWVDHLHTLATGAHRLRGTREPGKCGRFVLRPYQQAAVEFLPDRALLYDEQGVGKTLQAVAWADHSKPILVVAPKAVLGQWEAVLRDVMPTTVRPDYELALDLERGVLATDLERGVVHAWVTNYEQLHRLTIPKHTQLIVDECHYVKNGKAARSKAVQAVSKLVSRILLLSGTPLINRPLDLWIPHVLCGQRGTNQFWGWVQRYCGPEHTGWGWDFNGATYLDELRDDMLHWSLRREVKEVVPDMPARVETEIPIAIDAKSAIAVQQQDDYIFDVLGHGVALDGQLQELRMVTANAKKEGIREWIVNHLQSGGGNVLVFCTFKDPLRYLEIPMYTGDTSEADREEILTKARSGELQVLGLTYGAGAHGLDGLQQAFNTVVLMDLPWTNAEVDQAVSRAHRPGQQHPVQVIYPTCGSVIEKYILQCLDRKESIRDALVRVGRNLGT